MNSMNKNKLTNLNVDNLNVNFTLEMKYLIMLKYIFIVKFKFGHELVKINNAIVLRELGEPQSFCPPTCMSFYLIHS